MIAHAQAWRWWAAPRWTRLSRLRAPRLWPLRCREPQSTPRAAARCSAISAATYFAVLQNALVRPRPTQESHVEVPKFSCCNRSFDPHCNRRLTPVTPRIPNRPCMHALLHPLRAGGAPYIHVCSDLSWRRPRAAPPRAHPTPDADKRRRAAADADNANARSTAGQWCGS